MGRSVWYNDKEIDILDGFLKGKHAQKIVGKLVSNGELEDLAAQLADAREDKFVRPASGIEAELIKRQRELGLSRKRKRMVKKQEKPELTPSPSKPSSSASSHNKILGLTNKFQKDIDEYVRDTVKKASVSLEKRLAETKRKNAVLVRIIRATCHLRQAVAAYTQTLESLKKDGIDVYALLAEEE